MWSGMTYKCATTRKSGAEDGLRARELESAERQNAAERHPNISEGTKNKRLLLTQEMLEDFGYEDIEVLQCCGHPCRQGAGKKCGQLEASVAQRNALVLRKTSPYEDPEVDKTTLGGEMW